jgi:ethanolamine phosphate transferase 2 subunit G
MANLLWRLGLFIANGLLPLSIYFFCSGFFPYKPILPGNASGDQILRPAIFDKVIIMIVDSLRR